MCSYTRGKNKMQYPKCPVCGAKLEENPDMSELVCQGETEQHLFEQIFEDTDCNSILDVMGIETTGRYSLYHTFTFNKDHKDLIKIGEWGNRYPGKGYYGKSQYPVILGSDSIPNDDDPIKHL